LQIISLTPTEAINFLPLELYCQTRRREVDVGSMASGFQCVWNPAEAYQQLQVAGLVLQFQKPTSLFQQALTASTNHRTSQLPAIPEKSIDLTVDNDADPGEH
jgi:hypothetical protein